LRRFEIPFRALIKISVRRVRLNSAALLDIRAPKACAVRSKQRAMSRAAAHLKSMRYVSHRRLRAARSREICTLSRAAGSHGSRAVLVWTALSQAGRFLL